MSLELSVVIPAHNPRASHLQSVIDALRAQTLPHSQWELIVVDNRSQQSLNDWMDLSWQPNAALFYEEKVGLTHARLAGFKNARGAFLVLVDDDNVLAPDYLERVVGLFAVHPRIGALGGKIAPRFEYKPAPWAREFFGLIACRDLGESPIVSNGLWDESVGRNAYPLCAPVGAGMALRKEAAQAWLDCSASQELLDRQGSQLSSAGDNDIVFTLMKAGWKVAYFPELSLTHLIPAERLDANYLARLNREIQKSWMQVLTKHDANPWPPVPSWTVPVRKLKAWFAYRAWSGPAARIRWQGACGHFEGRTS